MNEIEVKLGVEGSFEMPSFLENGMGIVDVETRPLLHLRATYYDTTDLRLARNGITLRWRTGDEAGPAWTLKFPLDGEHGIVRRELEFEGKARVVPREARDLLTAFVRSARISPVASLRTKRRRWVLRGQAGEELAEISDDDVSILKDKKQEDAFREIEVEGRALDRDGVERVAELLRASGATPAPPLPKLVRVLGASATEAPELAGADPVDPTDPAAAAVRSTIAGGVHRLMWNDPGTRLGEVEPLHQMRVAARRLRSDLRTFGPLLDESWSEGLAGDLAWLGRLLGAVRDLDVLHASLRAAAEDLGHDLEPFFDSLAAQRRTEHVVLLDAMGSPYYLEMLERLIEAARDPAVTADAAGSCESVLPPLAQNAWRRAARKGRNVGLGDAEEDLHRVRILTKRARYAAEAVGPALGGKRASAATAFASRAAKVQDALGDLQDSTVARESIARIAMQHSADGPLNFAAGRLLERQLQVADKAGNDFEKAWDKLDRKKLRGWMKD